MAKAKGAARKLGRKIGGVQKGGDVSAGAMMPVAPFSSASAAWWMSPWFVLFALALAIIAFLSYLLWRKSEPAHQAPIVVLAKDGSAPLANTGMSVSATNHNLPINPTRDPQYPLRNARTDFQQMGVLIAESEPGTGGEPTILPLLGKPAETHRDRWKYYTATDKYHMMRIPVAYQSKNCQEDVGCQEIYDGDTVSIPAYKDKVFTAQIYKYEAPQYDPNSI